MVLFLGSPKGSSGSGSGYVSVNNYMSPMWDLHGLKFPCGTAWAIRSDRAHMRSIKPCVQGVFFFLFGPQSTNFQSCRDGSSRVDPALNR